MTQKFCRNRMVLDFEVVTVKIDEYWYVEAHVWLITTA